MGHNTQNNQKHRVRANSSKGEPWSTGSDLAHHQGASRKLHKGTLSSQDVLYLQSPCKLPSGEDTEWVFIAMAHWYDWKQPQRIMNMTFI